MINCPQRQVQVQVQQLMIDAWGTSGVPNLNGTQLRESSKITAPMRCPRRPCPPRATASGLRSAPAPRDAGMRYANGRPPRSPPGAAPLVPLRHAHATPRCAAVARRAALWFG